MNLNLCFASPRTPDKRAPPKLTEQMVAVLFCSRRLAILTGDHIGICESAEMVGSRSGRKSIYRHKDS